jgi:hypothetical protein
MSEKYLPIKVVLKRNQDTKANQGGGSIKFFGEVTDRLKADLIDKFNAVSTYYASVFSQAPTVPAVGKITVREEAIAKSHKPNDLCRFCSIIGGERLDEIYIKVTGKAIERTIQLIQNPPSERVKANLTVIKDIQPIAAKDKIAATLQGLNREQFEQVKHRIKIKLFDFDDDLDNLRVSQYVTQQLDHLGFQKQYEFIHYGSLNLIKLQVNDYQDIDSLSQINGIKSIDVFQRFSLPKLNQLNIDLKNSFSTLNFDEKKTTIGIIDGGISEDNPYLVQDVIAREVYVAEAYQNRSHGTFIASMIQYSNLLNDLPEAQHSRFKFVDIVAIPNSDETYGEVDYTDEDELMSIIEETMHKYAGSTKIWNLSLGMPDNICGSSISTFGEFLDQMQAQYNVQFVVSSGNYLLHRQWPSNIAEGDDQDRIISPADSVRAISVGSVALFDSKDSVVKKNEPSSFSRRGPGVGYSIKPDMVEYGGNCDFQTNCDGIGMRGMDCQGNVIEDIGTSYATPRVAKKLAYIYDELQDKDLLLAKAMLIHSARMHSRLAFNLTPDEMKYYGFGLPAEDVQQTLLCSESEVTLIFKQQIAQGTHLEMLDFPYPPSLIESGLCKGEIAMTLVYNPILDKKFGEEYCRTNIDVSFGTFGYDKNNKISFKGHVPLERVWDEKFEQSMVENGFKWNSIKSYYRKLSRVEFREGWKLRIDVTPRGREPILPQEFILVMTIRAPNNNDIYTEMINGLRDKGFITVNLETQQTIRQTVQS